MLSEKYLTLLKNEAKKYNIELSEEKQNKFSMYADLLVKWNEKINLTAITDEEGITIKHFLDSLSIFSAMPENIKTVIDVGTGAGFPGIPMKIADDDLKVTLLDSLAKRVNFLNEVCDALSLKNIRAFHGRAEDFGADKNYREQFDIATARAVAALPVLLEYCLPFVKVGGYFIAMKGPDVDEELKESKKALIVLGGEIIDVKKFMLYNSDNERCIVMIKKYRHTPPKYPRKSGKPTKSPIK
ncbi:MAG: 16S rRNA (guanine(527)-N(7))-methyltransferase RsmG [Clostridiaceae bacterium]|nr:16S rRNA (guanine(527)-N(7))-methyltransferase RsmG [Clostridiaceae bacterium]